MQETLNFQLRPIRPTLFDKTRPLLGLQNGTNGVQGATGAMALWLQKLLSQQ